MLGHFLPVQRSSVMQERTRKEPRLWLQGKAGRALVCRKSVAAVRHRAGERTGEKERRPICGQALAHSSHPSFPSWSRQQTHCSQATTGPRHGLSVAPCVCPAEASLAGRGSSPAERTFRESGYGCSTKFAVRQATQKRSPAARIRLRSTPRTCSLYRSASSMWLIVAAPQLLCKPNRPGASHTLSKFFSAVPWSTAFPACRWASHTACPNRLPCTRPLHCCREQAEICCTSSLLHVKGASLPSLENPPAERGRAKEFSYRACVACCPPALAGRRLVSDATNALCLRLSISVKHYLC